MRDTLRDLLARPISAEHRRRLAFICGGALFVVAVVLARLGSDPVAEPPRVEREPAAVRTATPTPTVDPALVPLPPEGQETDPPSRAEISRAKRAARAFLREYVPYTFEQADAAGLPYATDALRAALAERPPRVPDTVRRRQHRADVELMQVETATNQRIALLVVVRDLDLRFSLELQLARYESGWLVTAVGD